MGRRISFHGSAGVLALALGLFGCAIPEPPTPVCGRPDVLRRVTDILSVQGRPVALEPSAGEVSLAPPTRSGPDAGPLVARCAIRAYTAGFDTNRFGSVPVHESFLVNYTAELRHNGVFVRVD